MIKYEYLNTVYQFILVVKYFCESAPKFLSQRNIFTNDPHRHVKRCGIATPLRKFFSRQSKEMQNSWKCFTAKITGIWYTKIGWECYHNYNLLTKILRMPTVKCDKAFERQTTLILNVCKLHIRIQGSKQNSTAYHSSDRLLSDDLYFRVS